MVEKFALVGNRPSQYGFLTTLQQQLPEGVWPEPEDPFALFGDLVRLLQLPPGEDMCAGGEGWGETVKYLGAPAEADSGSSFHRFYVRAIPKPRCAQALDGPRHAVRV